LFEHEPVNRRWCLIHATHTAATEIAALAGSGAVAGLCPITEASLGDGIFPAREFLDAGGRFGVGTDSNVLIGAADELRQLEYGQRLRHRERNVLSGGAGASTGRALFDHALAGGAQALAQATVGLTPGARADIEKRILTGEWPPGHRIPFEHELVVRYGCSRMTVNKALSELAQADLIERRRRAGSFVRRPQHLSAVLKIADIGAEINALGRGY